MILEQSRRLPETKDLKDWSEIWFGAEIEGRRSKKKKYNRIPFKGGGFSGHFIACLLRQEYGVLLGILDFLKRHDSSPGEGSASLSQSDFDKCFDLAGRRVAFFHDFRESRKTGKISYSGYSLSSKFLALKWDKDDNAFGFQIGDMTKDLLPMDLLLKLVRVVVEDDKKSKDPHKVPAFMYSDAGRSFLHQTRPIDRGCCSHAGFSVEYHAAPEYDGLVSVSLDYASPSGDSLGGEIMAEVSPEDFGEGKDFDPAHLMLLALYKALNTMIGFGNGATIRL